MSYCNQRDHFSSHQLYFFFFKQYFQHKAQNKRNLTLAFQSSDLGERGGSVVECRTPEQEVGGSKPTAAVLCPWARHFTPRKY